jgi:hypothetical protein
MLPIIVESEVLRSINFTDKKTGLPRVLRIQEARVHVYGQDGKLSQYPDKFEIVLQRDQAPYPAGKYTLDPRGLYVNREKKLSVTPTLLPGSGAR